jgi:hypothetical protein
MGEGGQVRGYQGGVISDPATRHSINTVPRNPYLPLTVVALTTR